MPTLPPEQARAAAAEPHQHRAAAESFGTDAERYDRHRPTYPEALVARIAATSPSVLDVGTGTGIAARQFRAAGCRVLGVEPDARMADVARRHGIDVEVATFEAWDPADRTFDAVVAGQAWHWVDPIAGAAQAARVLRPGGRLATFWYVAQPPPELTENFATAYHRVVPDSPIDLRGLPKQALEGYQTLFDRAADGIRADGRFDEPEQWRYDESRSHSRDEWLARLATSGALTSLAPELLAQVLAGVGAAVDALGGVVPVQYTTVAVTAIRSEQR